MREFRFRIWIDTIGEIVFFDIKDIYTGGINKNNIMQYIGIQDKNNKPIYEGDIVKTLWQYCGVTNWEFEFIGKIIYSLEHLAFRILSSDINFSRPLHNDSNEKLLSIEVIGNIYENPELLKKENENEGK